MTAKERQAARGQDCTLRAGTYLGIPCDGPDTTVLCHAPWKKEAAMGRKVPDRWAAFGCFTCHNLVDARDNRLTYTQKIESWMRGIPETQDALGVYEESK